MIEFERWRLVVWMFQIYHRVRWYATLENKTPAEMFPKFPSVLHVIDRSDRTPPITATSVTFRPSLPHASKLWLLISIRSVDNTYDWWKFWKRFRRCFVFESRVSTKTVVSSKSQIWQEKSNHHYQLGWPGSPIPSLISALVVWL